MTDNIWRERFEEQRAYNRQLESELALFEEKGSKLQAQLKGTVQHSLSPLHRSWLHCVGHS